MHVVSFQDETKVDTLLKLLNANIWCVCKMVCIYLDLASVDSFYLVKIFVNLLDNI